MSDSKEKTQQTTFTFSKKKDDNSEAHRSTSSAADVERSKSQPDVTDAGKSTSSTALPDDNPTPGLSSANTDAKKQFQPKCFDRYPWLHYDTCSDSVLCG